MTAPGFLNYHPFFVHAPVVLIPAAAIMMWLGRRLRNSGFDLAVLLITLAAAAGSLAALATGLYAGGTVAHGSIPVDLVANHRTNAIAITSIVSLAALLAVAEWRGWVTRRLWWLRAAFLTWAAIGVFFGAHSGAQLVYIHGAAVAEAGRAAGSGAAEPARVR